MTTAIKIEHLSKQYRLGQVGTGTLSHDLTRWWARVRGHEDPYAQIGQVNNRDKESTGDYVWALRDVNLEVEQGEVLGVIGANGAGKSTLLKLISRITSPTSGGIRARGRIASLLEVGTGMHPEMTARENVYLNGSILGMRRHEITKKFDDIMDFAGCLMFVDTPVKRFSSGMRVRLGFAVAAFLEPEILIVDEVLSVGDATFQAKAIGKMHDVASCGRTILFVSHNMASVERLCSRAVLISAGQVAETGPTAKIIESYLDSGHQGSDVPLKDRTDREGDGSARFLELWMENDRGEQLDVARTGATLTLGVRYTLLDPLERYKIAVGIYTSGGQAIVHFDTVSNPPPDNLQPSGVVKCHIPRLPLLSGRYSLNVSISRSTGQRADRIQGAMDLHVSEGDFFGTGKLPPKGASVLAVDHTWSVCLEDDLPSLSEGS